MNNSQLAQSLHAPLQKSYLIHGDEELLRIEAVDMLRAAAQQQGEKLAGAIIKLTQKAGVDGRLFGSVTNYDIAEELKKQHGVEVHKSQIRLPSGPIKTVGDSTVVIALHTDVLAEITVAVYGETA